MSRPDQTLCSIDTFKALVQAAPGEIEALLKTGAIKRAKPGFVALIPAVRSFIEYTRAQARNATLTSSQEQAKSARAAAAELSLMVERRELIPDEDAQTALDHLAGVIVTSTNIIAPRVTRDLRARAVIGEALRVALTAISADLEAMSR